MLRKHLTLTLVISCFFALFSLNVYAQSAQTLFRQAGDPVVGDRNGSVTMVEFMDYQCSHCIEMAPVVESLIRNNPSLRVVYKLVGVRGPQSEQAARAAIAANLQGKFKAFNRALVNANQELSDRVIFSLAKSSGLNVEKLKSDMNSASVDNVIKANMSLASDLNIPGTPAFYFGKTNAADLNSITSLIGAVNQRELQNAVNAGGQ